jgi:hypothetical protein
MSMNRRAFLRTLISTAVLGSVVLVGIAELFQLGTANNRQPQQTSQSSQVRPSSSTAQSQSSSASTSINTTSTSQQLGTPTGYVLAASLGSLGGKTSEYFNHPKYGNSILLSLSGQGKHSPRRVHTNLAQSSIRIPSSSVHLMELPLIHRTGTSPVVQRPSL